MVYSFKYYKFTSSSFGNFKDASLSDDGVPDKVHWFKDENPYHDS